MTNAKHLCIASVLLILLGAGSIAFTRFVLGNGDFSNFPLGPEQALLWLAGLYVLDAVKILAGLVGLLRAGHRALLTVVLGAIVFLAQLVSFLNCGGNVAAIVLNIVLLAIPYYYLHNAYKIFRQG